MNNEKCCLCNKPMGNSGSIFDNKPAHQHCIEEQTIKESVLSGRMQGEDKEPSDKNSMLYWFPKIKHLDILQPKTEYAEVNPAEVFEFIDGGALSNLNELFEKAKIIGYPLFLRSDQLSGKHNWKNTCFVEKQEDLIKHLRNIAEASYCCDILGKPVRAFFFREYIPMKNLFTAFFGEMPVNPEMRFFIEDGEIKCKHWYWCCSKDTEVLTDDGFKLFSELIGGEEIFTLNPKTKEIELHKPLKIIAQKYTGKMIHIKNNSFDMLVTPDHRIPILIKNDIKFVQAKELPYNYRIPRTGTWKGSNNNKLTLGNTYFETKFFFEFMGYFLSEGCVNRNIFSPNITLSQNPDKQEPMLNCLKRMGIDYKVYGKNIQILKIKTKYKDLFNYLSPIGKSYQKFIPKELKQYSPKYLTIFLNSFRFGDGTITFDKNYGSTIRCFYTSSKQLANDLAELILKTGRRPSIYQKHKKSKFIIKNKEYRTKHPVYTVIECGSTAFSCRHSIAMKTIDYDDMVYCVTMPKNHIIYVKRNGKCSWTGNCEDSIINPSVPNWKEILKKERESMAGNELFGLQKNARKVAVCFKDEGFWSVDFCKSMAGEWALIDMALGSDSWHPEDCMVNKTKVI